jgi:undecaprenyl diphosphate synthase
MDGNGRWAHTKGKSRQYGHKIGSSKVYDVFKLCTDLGCKSATFFAMSSENMQRDDVEIEFISKLLESSIKKHFVDLLENKIKFKVIGDTSSLTDDIKKLINTVECATQNFTEFKMYIAYNYGGQWDIINAIKLALSDNNTISQDNLSRYLSTENDFPDLIVRTGGYKRLSNFMLWQAVYSELEFLDVLWPDISKRDIELIFEQYTDTKRNFGIVKQ